MPEQINKMLLAVDGTPRSRSTARYTAKMLRPGQAKVVIFGVVTLLPDYFQDMGQNPAMRNRLKGVRDWSSKERLEMTAFLDWVHAEFRRQGHPEDMLEIKMVESYRGASTEIVREAQDSYGTVAIGRRGRTILRGLALGGTSSKLIMELTRHPLWLVGKGAMPGRMLLAVDTSPYAQKVVDFVARMTRGEDIRITLMHVMLEEERALQARTTTKSPKEVRAYLEELAQGLTDGGISASSIRTALLTESTSRAKAIVREARQRSYSTIVLGRQGSSAGGIFSLGRVANKVVQLSRGLAVWLIN